MGRHLVLATAIGLSLLLAACATQAVTEDATPADSTAAESVCGPVDASQQFPDVIEAELEPSGDDFSISVTMCSPYDTPGRYADGWRVLTPDGEVLAEHELAHDHANEQPFTRTRGPFPIPDDVDEVVVEGRDQANGYGGETVTADVPR
ncbi:hypothetical protein ARHIZOSPH14_25930 [Agromyces rhizosphaerae]|uniref:Lipoprotein n=1 Tax=Agromyces rhizosphaerae TaxID=88374 RepID=A0A9W6FQ96_9MICO|nr:hypothetical protein [Agromyces rhizosphaerae]GLI28351.1 hypothetical protein ARHIZOSPH14_25930 [Agromyces rhizosphaerae]